MLLFNLIAYCFGIHKKWFNNYRSYNMYLLKHNIYIIDFKYNNFKYY